MNWQAQHKALVRTWESYNILFFKGALRTPVILIDELEDGVTRIFNLRLFGTYKLIEIGESKIEITAHLFQPATGVGGPAFDKFKLWIAEDVLLHEMVHQHLVESGRMDVNEWQHRGHGHKFAEVCNLLGNTLELQPVYMHQRPYCYAWPHSAKTNQQIKQAMSGLSSRERGLAVRLMWHIAQNGPDDVGPPTSGGRVVRQASVLVA